MEISIHALLAESDFAALHDILKLFTFLSTLSLRRATHINRRSDHIKRFLSTLSLRRATLLLALMICPPRDFYPRSPCGERRGFGVGS